MIKNPLVSVLMPAFNAQPYIDESIKSILRQSFKNFELLILDDASTDNTYKFAKRYEKKDKRVRVFCNKLNKNIAVSRNILVSKARGKYIAWQDADDVSVKDRLKWQVNFLKKHPDVGMVGGYLKFFNKDGVQNIRKYASNDKQLRKKIFRYSPVAQPTAMIKKEALEYAGKYGKNLSPAEDIEISFRIGVKYQFANIPKITLKYRNYHQSSTYQKLKKVELVTIKTRLTYIFHKSYSFSLMDLVYNILQLASIFLIPARLKIKLFNLIRNS